MALQTANQFQLVPDLASRFTGGIQSGQGISSQLQIGQQRGQQIEQGEELAASKRLVNSALTIGSLPDDQKLNALISNRDAITLRGGNAEETDKFIQLAKEGKFEDLNASFDAIVSIGERQGLIKPQAVQPGFKLGQGQTQFSAAGTEIASVAPTAEKPVVTSALDQARIDKLNAETAALGKGKTTETPALDALVAGASPELQQRSKAAFELAGGGDKGVKALQKVLEGGVESERRAAAPQTLKANFPQADEAELSELQAVVDSAKTTESGFKSADKLREKQRQTKKGRVFQTRAVELLDRILANPEISDVIGSREGADKSIIPFVSGTTFRSDVEADAVADIDEVRNILTAGNLGIMSGVLSETDIKIIADLAGGALNRTRTEESFIKDVTALRERVAGEFGILPKGVTEDDITTTMEVNNLTRAQVLDRLGRK